MVMATPSPQQVGREFVRQYYTVLHEAPDVLHRFYSSGSTFVHGGVDQPDRPFEEPVVGQLEIDKKIKNLNFKDCHTKIRQVDSQLTIGSGVVVQVTGELSNNGEPMRRFMQTFVLAPQTPKKFYVHNDIFRYQDEVYQDNSDTESEDQHIEASLITKTAVLNMNNYYEQNHQQEEATGQQSTSSMSSSLPILTSPTHAGIYNLFLLLLGGQKIVYSFHENNLIYIFRSTTSTTATNYGTGRSDNSASVSRRSKRSHERSYEYQHINGRFKCFH